MCWIELTTNNISDSYFETFLTSYPMLADITHESFLIKCAEYFDAYIKKNKGESVLNAISRLSSDSETFYNRYVMIILFVIIQTFNFISYDILMKWHNC